MPQSLSVGLLPAAQPRPRRGAEGFGQAGTWPRVQPGAGGYRISQRKAESRRVGWSMQAAMLQHQIFFHTKLDFTLSWVYS